MKTIYSDLDNTLIFDGVIPEENLNAIKRWKDAGNLFVISTGRGVNMMHKIHKDYPKLADYYILNSGALILDKDLNTLFIKTMDKNSFNNLLLDISDDYFSAVDTDDKIYSIGKFEDEVVPEVVEIIIEKTKEELIEMDINVIYFNCCPKSKKLEDAINLYDRLKKKHDDKVSIFRNKTWLDIVPKDISKAIGIEKLSNLKNIDKENSYVIGDSLNDIPMFEYTHNSYSFNNAEEIVKNKANKLVNHLYEMIDELLV